MDINLASSSAAGVKVNVGGEPLKSSFRGVETENTSLIEPIEQVDKSSVTKNAISSEVKLEQVASELSDMMSLMRKGLAFKVDDKSGLHVVSVMDIDSGDVIRQIPSEEALRLAQKLTEVTGFLMKTEA